MAAELPDVSDGLTSFDARVITDKKSLFDLNVFPHPSESGGAFNAVMLSGYGSKVNDEARGGSWQTFAQRTELGAKSR